MTPVEHQPPTPAQARPSATIKWFIAAAWLLPVLSLFTCARALRPYADESTILWALVFFALSLVAGLVVLVFAILGRQRRSSAIAFGVNAAGVLANLAYFVTHFSYTRGRQIVGPAGRVLPARAEQLVAESLRARAARAWRNNGDTEAASVSAFALLSLDLAELGAPLDLVRAAHEDALDEVRHAELCYALARSWGEADATSAPMPALATVRSRPCSLARVAVESWVEGAYLEAVSAEIARALVTKVTDTSVRGVLEAIATDESKPARDAWTIVAWCLRRDPRAVSAALEEAAANIPAPTPRDDALGADGTLEPYGIAGNEMQRAVAARCLAVARARLADLLCSARDGEGASATL